MRSGCDTAQYYREGLLSENRIYPATAFASRGSRVSGQVLSLAGNVVARGEIRSTGHIVCRPEVNRVTLVFTRGALISMVFVAGAGDS